MRRRIVFGVEVGAVEGAAEERHRVVAAGAPAAAVDVAVAGQHHLARLLHAGGVDLVVERAEAVRARQPAAMRVGVALGAVVVDHQRRGRDRLAAGGAGERRREADGAVGDDRRAAGAHVDRRGQRTRAAVAAAQVQAAPPLQRPSAPAVVDERPDDAERGQHVQPVDDRAQARLPQLEPGDAHQRQAADQDHRRQRGQDVADAGGAPVGMGPGGQRVRRRVDAGREGRSPGPPPGGPGPSTGRRSPGSWRR